MQRTRADEPHWYRFSKAVEESPQRLHRRRKVVVPIKFVGGCADIPAMVTLKYLITLLLSRTLVVMYLCVAVWPAQAEPLQLDDLAIVNVWPAVRILADPDGTYSADELVRGREIINYAFQLFMRPSSKAREGRIAGYSTDEQRGGTGCMGG